MGLEVVSVKRLGWVDKTEFIYYAVMDNTTNQLYPRTFHKYEDAVIELNTLLMDR